MGILSKAYKLLVGSDAEIPRLDLIKKRRPLKNLTERELIQLESEIGKDLFGPIPSGRSRKFFNLDEKTWIWYEETREGRNKIHSTTTRYEVQDKGVLKVQEGSRYAYIEGAELRNFGLAVQMYYERVMRDVYRRDPATGQKML
ncbi:hypothetical protein H6796_02235 [Candidatus Nomurabacteria bacterium]|nr:hypothetical protein [Candidatus Nomurabacteria bacterium]